ncbi:hypothetical protein E4U43_000999 [Claviceps pusilla]|uniref:Uncharacterized protein n=1 Tax=Claviceps pusilla TaxID=123648 RepID=A0A9P7NH53_9HYPO|nr:hypothetical protein E4U43_000999 [Claviceps pusilla]
MSQDATEDMEPQLRLESAKAPLTSVSSVGNHRSESTAPGGQGAEQAHYPSTTRRSFKTDALRQAEVKAKAHLRKRRLRGASVTLAGESEPLKGKGTHLYFLSDGDVKDIVGIVMDAVRQSLMAPARPKTLHGSEASANFDDSFASGFAYGRNSITPRLSAAADPATTISMPKTVFSYTNWGDDRVSVAESRLDSSTKTTIVSRGSVSEIVWTEHQASDGTDSVTGIRDSLSSAGKFHDATSQHCLKCHSLSKCGRCRNMIEAEREASLCRFASLLPMSTNPVTNKRTNRSTDEESNMTSFPELRPRNCTNDWLKPPVEIDQLLRDKTSDLYRRGVDAHSGLGPNSPQSTWASPPSLSIPYDESVFRNNSFFSTGPCFQERRQGTETSMGDDKKKHSRNTISSVSYTHRTSQITAANQSPWQSDGELLPQIVDKLRHISQDRVHGEDIHIEDGGTWPSEPEILPPPEASAAVVTRSRDSIIRERTLKPPTADKLGIYEALTGSRMMTLRKRCMNCSEDNRPHVCEDDLDSRTSLG